MNKDEVYNYIIENFDISGEAGRLIINILHFVSENYSEKREQYKALYDLLDGTIGLEEEEVKRFCHIEADFI